MNQTEKHGSTMNFPICLMCMETSTNLIVVKSPCTHDPKTLKGQPIGMYHCPECGVMVIAGLNHPPCCIRCAFSLIGFSNMKLIVIPVEGRIEVKEPKDGKTFSLDELQSFVGGLIESVPINPKSNLTIYVNEEGLIDHLPLNPRGSRLVAMINEQAVDSVYLVGPMVILGKADEEGYETTVLDSFIDLVESIIS